ncbi:MAG: EamA family transporter [Gemmatimonadota bacterium]
MAVRGTHGSTGGIVFASIALYLVWGITYIANRVAVAELPSFALAAVRFLVAGGVLFAWLRWRGVPGLTGAEWRVAVIVGFLLCLGNAFVAWAVHIVPLGIAAVLVAMTPGFLVLFDWLRPDGRRPGMRVVVGLVLGVIGIAVLMSARQNGARAFNPLGAVLILFGTIAWSGGSIYSRQAARPESPFMQTASQMLAGGAALLPIALILGQFRGVSPGQLSAAWWQAFAFLVIFGSIVGFSAYVYLLSHSSPATAGSYAFVNPVIAAISGWILFNEHLAPRAFAAFAIILFAVALIVSASQVARKPATPPVVDEPACA